MTIPAFSALGALQRRLPEAESKHTAAILDVANECSNKAERIYKLMTEPDENLSHLAISKQILESREALAAYVFSAKKVIKDFAQKERDRLNSAANEAVGLVADQFAAEIRGIFRTLDRPNKERFIVNAINKRNGAELAAILNAPAVLSGIEPEVLDAYRNQFQSMAAPRGAIQHLDDVVQQVEHILNVSLTV